VADLTHHLRDETALAQQLLAEYRQQLDEDEQAIADTIEGETNLMGVIDIVLNRLATIEDHVEALTTQGRKLNARNARFKAAHERLRAALLATVEAIGIKKLERPTATISHRKVPPTAVITNEAELPPQYLIPQPAKIDRNALNAALKEGSVPGAELSNGSTTISITRS
jgi:predicted nuclease with TOPRIM domain